MRSHKLLAFLLCLITGPALAGYMTLLGAGLGAIQPVAQATFTNSSYSTNLSNLTSIATFSRAGNATQFDSSGYLTYGPNNLLTQSNTFSDASWVKSNMSVASGATDPFGTTLAWTLTATGSGALLYQPQTLAGPNAIPYVWMRRKTGTGTVYLRNANNVSIDVTAQVSSTWAFVYVAPTAALGGNLFLIALATNGDEIEIYSAGYSAVTYETTPRTQDQVITTSAAYYGPRFDYDPTTLAVRGLLVEPPATNYWTNSEDATAWVKTNLTATVAPAGLYGSVALATLTVTGNGMARFDSPPIAVAAGQQVSHTVALLAGSVSTAEVGLYGFTSSWGLAADASCVVLSGPGVATRHSGGLFNITNLSASTPTLVRVTRTYLAAENAQAYVYLGSNGVRTAGETIKVGTPQTEFGAGSSYIISGASPTTRAAETVQLTGAALSTLQGGSWTAFVETGPMAGYEPATSTILGANNTQIALYVADATNFASYNGSSVLTATIGNSGNFLTGGVRSGVSTDASGRSIVANGGAVSSDGNRATPVAVTSAYLGSFNGAYSISGPVKSFAIYNSRLPDATLQQKSTVGATY